jgi:hypothetical protein
MSDPTSMHDDADDLRDPVLQRALENAPDQAATADWRLGQSIRAMAHEAVAPSLPELPVPAERSWWQRLLGIGAGGGVPWNAAFATVLVGVLVTLMWQREEVPGARPDGAQDKAAPAVVASAPPAAEIAQGAPAPAVEPAAPAAPEPAAKPAPAPSALDAQLAESRETTAAATRALDQEEARLKRERQADSDAAAARARVLKKEAARPPAPALPAPPAVPASPAAPAAADAPSARANKQAEIAERRAFAGAQDAAPAAAPPRAAAVAPAPAAPEPAAPAAPPSFVALSQWTVLHITRPDGETRTLQRAEARELGALIGSAALAGVSARPLRAKVDWRITLERNGEALAVMELAGGQVRWREEGVAPGIGTPGAGAMKGLRAALEDASAPAPSQPQSPSR